MTAAVIPLNAWKGTLQRDGKGGYRKNTTNLMAYLQNLPDFGTNLRLNELADVIEWGGERVGDYDYVDMRIVLEAEDLPFDRREMAECVHRAAVHHAYNPVQDYLRGLEWDKKPRLEQWLQECLGVVDMPIVRAFGRMFLISAVARALDPGCQVDTMLILEGPQGLRKSTAVAVLFGEEYTLHGLERFKGHDAGVALQGRWAIDLGELAAFEKNEFKTVKDFLTRRTDNYRPPYGRHFVDRARRVIFIGQTNEYSYLDDPTGARRFWPVACRSIDIPKLKRIRDQLWAEAVHRYSAKEQWWIERGTELDRWATTEQKARFREDVWATDIDTFLEQDHIRKRGCVLVSEILSSLGFKADRRDKDNEMRVANHLKHRQWTKVQKRIEGQKNQWWFPPINQEDSK
jgi:putative DNA primase/helicase